MKIETDEHGAPLAVQDCNECYGDGDRVFYLTPAQDRAVRELKLWGDGRKPGGSDGERAAVRKALELDVKQAVVAHALGMTRAGLALILRRMRETGEL